MLNSCQWCQQFHHYFVLSNIYTSSILRFIISAAPLKTSCVNPFKTPFLGQFFTGSDNSHLWSRLFYYHISGYGPPTLFLKQGERVGIHSAFKINVMIYVSIGTELKYLPRIFLGYVKLLITCTNIDSFVLRTEKFQSINEHLKSGCVLVQAYGIFEETPLKYVPFPTHLSKYL